MSKRGAKHLLLMSRNASRAISPATLDVFRINRTEVYLCDCDVTEKNVLQHSIDKVGLKYPIQGVIQAAGVLQDAIFENMTHQQWQKSLMPKVKGTANLHDLFQQPSLKFFIVLSSATSILGNSGQANYTTGGVFQDTLALQRIESGLPAVSINIGAVPSVGMAANDTIGSRLERTGYRSHTISEVLRLVDLAIRHPYHGQIITGIKPWAMSGDLNWRSEPRFACLQTEQDSNGDPNSTREMVSIRDRLANASNQTAESILTEALIERLAETFGKSTDNFAPHLPFSSYGVDSLIAVELRNWLASHVTPKVSVFDITQSLSIKDLAKKITSKIGL